MSTDKTDTAQANPKDRLWENKEETSVAVKKYLAKAPAELPPPKPIVLEDNPDLGKAMLALEERRDNKQGIVWHQSEAHTDGTVDLIRDARNATKPFPDPCPESRAIQVLNLTRAAIHILKTDRKITDALRKELLEKAQDAITAANTGEAVDSKKAPKQLLIS